jgi:LysR family transcriptional regulator, glycine cleavage system transcriptional activator
MRELPPLNALRAFEAAARHLSFTRAGAELHITHGAVSRQVQALETWLGAPLFRRLNRRIELTEAGTTLLAEFGAALDRIALASVRAREEGRVRVLRINALPTFTIRWLIPRLSGFQRRHPQVEVRVTTSTERIDKLPESFDLVIRGGPDRFRGYRSERFLDERRLPVCAPHLLERLKLTEPSDLRRHTLLHSDTLRGVWSDWLRLAGVPDLAPAHALTFEHFYLSIQAAVDELGVAMGPSALVAEDLESGRLVAPFPDIALPARSYCWYLRDEKAADPVVQAFCQWLAQISFRAGMREADGEHP